MTRHARNCTAGAVYSYHEKKKDTKTSGYGSQSMRLGKDSVKEFDCCCLTLQPCQNPVITPDGYLYDKEAILEYILHQKRDIAKKLKQYEKQKEQHSQKASQQSKAEKKEKLAQFMAKQSIGKPGESSSAASAVAGASAKEEPSTSKSLSNVADGRDKELPSFWIPTLTPEAEKTQLKKPDEKVRCPMSGKPLKMKDLMDIKFKEIQDRDDKRSLITKDARYVCAVTNDVLGNSVPCAALRTSGVVVTMECVEKLIKKDMRDPINGKALTEKDIVPLNRGATGFSGTGVDLKAKKAGPAMLV